ncbi:MAG: C39 family peptidase [Candidatus Rokubacteria bacterium]|nr:C39 family peptidase [Candidatus Rokubacteria bacterium]
MAPTPAPGMAGADAVVDFPEWRPRRPARHLVPAFSARAPDPFGFRFELSGRAGGTWSPWVGGAAIGEARFAPVAERSDAVAADIDEFRASAPVEAVRLRLRVSAADPGALFREPWLVSLSAWDGESAAAEGRSPGRGARLAVPAVSQMAEEEAIRLRICSPASVAMVLAYYGARVDLTALAREIFHPGLDRFGVWPAAIVAAARRGLAGYLLRFPDWESAAWCLARGLPVIASVRYGTGELAGAAIAETTGHLLVLTGWEGDEVLVNDPAAATAGEVARRYPLDGLRRVWLARAGVGYVLFRPPTSPSDRSPQP